MSTDLHTLSGAYALDALSEVEAAQFRRHLEGCAVCQQEVRELQQTAAAMGAAEALVPPAHLRADVLQAVDRTPQLPPYSSAAPAATTGAPTWTRRWGPRLLGAAAAAVLVVGAMFGLGQLGDDAEQQLAQGVVRVFEADDANTATMETANGGTIAVATSPELGQMAVDTDELPALDDQHVYQLWAISNGETASVGVLERERGASMPMPTPSTEVAITIEPAGGSEQPTSEPIMRVNPSQV
jgi:anti-sigma-K factor RskA